MPEVDCRKLAQTRGVNAEFLGVRLIDRKERSGGQTPLYTLMVRFN